MALPFTLARLLLSFLPGRAIPSLLGVSHTARRLCACLHELDLSSCKELDDVQCISSLVRLRTLDLSGCIAPSSLTPMQEFFSRRGPWAAVPIRRGQLADVSPLSSLLALETLHLVGCEQLAGPSPP